MGKIFYLSEIVKFALEKEQDSIELYRNLAEMVVVKELKDLFEKLRKEEEKHKTFYSNILTEIKKQQTPNVQENDEYLAYLRELISASRKTPPLELDKLTDISEAIDFAIAREKDSILFYAGLKNYVSSNMEKKLDPIIKEEAKHAALLINIREANHA